MNSKKILTILMAGTLATGLVGCGNDTSKTTEEPAQTEEAVEETVVDTAQEAKEATDKGAENVTEGLGTEGAKDIYDLEFAYLPEGFVVNFDDQKSDLHTIEYMAEKNPAKKIQLQISNNEERFGELVTVPDDAEDLEISGQPAKYWTDGSFEYVVVTKDGNHMYARSTLDKEETIKVVEAIN